MNSMQPKLGTAAIALDKDIFYIGEEITGNVLLQVYTAFDSQKIEVVLIGMEKLKDKANPILSKKQKLYEFKSEILPFLLKSDVLYEGRYKIPFKVQVNKDVPGSSTIQEKKFKSSVKHKLIFNLASFTSNKSLSAFVYVKMRENKKITQQQTYEAEIFKTIYSCFGCMNERECHVLCSVQNNEYFSGDNCEVQMLVENNSSLNIASFTLSLYEVFQTSYHMNPNLQTNSNLTESNQIKNELMRNCIHQNTFSGVPAQSPQIHLCFKLLLADDNKAEPLSPSYQGTFSLHYYFIEVKTHFEGWSTPPLVIQIPVQISLSKRVMQRTIQDIQSGVISKEMLRFEEIEAILDDFNETKEKITSFPLQILKEQVPLTLNQNQNKLKI